MSPNQGTLPDPSPQNVPGEGAAVSDASKQEIALVKLYQKLTGEDESRARSAFIYTLRDDEDFTIDRKT